MTTIRKVDFSVLDNRLLEVLHGVEQLKNSKEIARDIGISPHTVDQRLKRVQSLLKVSSRFEAARIYREQYLQRQDAGSDDQSLVYQSSALSNSHQKLHDEASSGEWNPAVDSKEVFARKAQAAYSVEQADGDEAAEGHSLASLSVLFGNDRQNELSLAARVTLIGAIAIAAIAIFGLLISAAEGLSRLF